MLAVVSISLILLTLVGSIAILLMGRRALAILLGRAALVPVRKLGRLHEDRRAAVARSADAVSAGGVVGCRIRGSGRYFRCRLAFDGGGRRRRGSRPSGRLCGRGGAIRGAVRSVAIGRAVGAMSVAIRTGAITGHAGGIENAINDVGLLGPGRRLQRHGLGDGTELVALLAFENRPFELLFRSHRAPLP